MVSVARTGMMSRIKGAGVIKMKNRFRKNKAVGIEGIVELKHQGITRVIHTNIGIIEDDGRS